MQSLVYFYVKTNNSYNGNGEKNPQYNITKNITKNIMNETLGQKIQQKAQATQDLHVGVAPPASSALN